MAPPTRSCHEPLARRFYAELVHVVDVILILLMLVFAISGYRQGFVIGALSFGGFFSGALIGLQVGPLIANQFSDGAIRVVVSLVAIFALAVLGQTLAGWFGTKLRRSMTSRPGSARAPPARRSPPATPPRGSRRRRTGWR